MANGIKPTVAPPPPAGNGRPRGPSGLYATRLVALEAGQGLEIDNAKERSGWSSAASYWGRVLGRRFVTRALPSGGFGIWRVE